MITHIVMWTLKDEADGRPKAENAQLMKKALEGMRREITEILRLEVGLNVVPGTEAFDIVLCMEFEDLDALARYQVHPAHERVKMFIRSVRDTRAVVDYEAE